PTARRGGCRISRDVRTEPRRLRTEYRVHSTESATPRSRKRLRGGGRTESPRRSAMLDATGKKVLHLLGPEHPSPLRCAAALVLGELGLRDAEVSRAICA